MKAVLGTFVGVVAALFVAVPQAWNNGQAGNTTTNLGSECDDVPYATHDWIAHCALELLPDDEKDWLEEHEYLYLSGTEALDNRTFPSPAAVLTAAMTTGQPVTASSGTPAPCR